MMALLKICQKADNKAYLMRHIIAWDAEHRSPAFIAKLLTGANIFHILYISTSVTFI